MSRVEAIVFGTFLLTVGIVLTLGNMGKLDTLDTLRRTWPLMFLLWGALEVVAAARRRPGDER